MDALAQTDTGSSLLYPDKQDQEGEEETDAAGGMEEGPMPDNKEAETLPAPPPEKPPVTFNGSTDILVGLYKM